MFASMRITAISTMAGPSALSAPRSSSTSSFTCSCGVVKKVMRTAIRMAVPVAPRMENVQVAFTTVPAAVVTWPVRPGMGTLRVVNPRAPLVKRCCTAGMDHTRITPVRM